ncbi:MAG: thioredoxin domain-containing protein [Acidobacteria bacterium]|nr:thioredoxin domain-containing protein [Acidobacteriota bacterium]
MSKEVKILGAIGIVVIVIAIIGTYSYRNSAAPTPSNVAATANSAPMNSETLIRPDSYTLGSADAKITIVEFFDPECESCAAFSPIMKSVLKEYGGTTRLVARYMPLHPNSLSAATFLEAAGEQGKYWQAMEKLFEKQPEWGTKHGPQPAGPQADITTLFKKYATDLGLDLEKMNAAYSENRFAEKIARDKSDGESLGVRQTPTIFVNGRQLSQLSEPALKYLIDEELKK